MSSLAGFKYPGSGSPYSQCPRHLYLQNIKLNVGEQYSLETTEDKSKSSRGEQLSCKNSEEVGKSQTQPVCVLSGWGDNHSRWHGQLGFAHLETRLLWMDVQCVPCRFTIYAANAIYLLSEDGQRGQRLSVLWQSPGASEESPFLQKPAAPRPEVHLIEWAPELSGHIHRLGGPCPISIPKSHLPKALKGPHSAPPRRLQTWRASFEG